MRTYSVHILFSVAPYRNGVMNFAHVNVCICIIVFIPELCNFEACLYILYIHTCSTYYMYPCICYIASGKDTLGMDPLYRIPRVKLGVFHKGFVSCFLPGEVIYVTSMYIS